MGTTARNFRYPATSDTPDVPRDIQNLAQDLDDYFSNNGITINGSLKKFGDSATIDSLPAQTDNAGKYLTTDGSVASWATISIPSVNQATPTMLGTAYGLFDTDFYMPTGITAIGYNALHSESSTSNSSAFGMNALVNNTGSNVNAFGANSLNNNTGNFNSAFGTSTLGGNTGSSNSGFGQGVMTNSVSGNWNSAFGRLSLEALTSGYQNTAIGGASGNSLVDGYNNTFIGYDAQPSTTNAANEITLGNSSISVLRSQVTSITSLSDRRDKTKIEPLSTGLDLINALKPVKFVWNMRDGGKVDEPDTGFIAQDLIEIEDATGIAEYLQLTYRKNPDKLEASYGRLVPILVKAIQDLSKELNELKAKVG